MNIVLYNNNEDRRTVPKTLTTITTTFIGVHLKEDTDIINPTFRLSKVSPGTLSHSNYLYCEYLQRYYFIENMRYCEGGIWELDCHVDVLQTYHSQILSKNAYITRQEKGASKNNYFYDSNYPVRSDVTCYPLGIGSVGSGVGYYLTVNGGVQ